MKKLIFVILLGLSACNYEAERNKAMLNAYQYAEKANSQIIDCRDDFASIVCDISTGYEIILIHCNYSYCYKLD